MDKYFQLLGINQYATIEEIEKAYYLKLEQLKTVQTDDETYLKVKRKRLKEAYCAILLFRETGKLPPDKVIGNVDAMEQMLVRVRLEKSEKPKSAKVKGKNKGNWMIAFLLFAVLAIVCELIPVKKFDSAQQVYLSQYAYEQTKEQDLYIAEVAEASKAYILAYAEEHPREYTQGGTPRYGLRRTEKCEEDFIKTYWGYESFGEVADYLCGTYEGYTCDSSYDVGCDHSIYAFYGFLPYTDIMGYRNPFNGGVIEYTYQLYLYYTEFYEAYQNGEIPISAFPHVS